MSSRRSGRSGLKVSEVCLGTWINFGGRAGDDETFAVMNVAIEEGIDVFDVPDVYPARKAATVLGRWVQCKDRRTLTVATKGR